MVLYLNKVSKKKKIVSPPWPVMPIYLTLHGEASSSMGNWVIREVGKFPTQSMRWTEEPWGGHSLRKWPSKNTGFLLGNSEHAFSLVQNGSQVSASPFWRASFICSERVKSKCPRLKLKALHSLEPINLPCQTHHLLLSQTISSSTRPPALLSSHQI